MKKTILLAILFCGFTGMAHADDATPAQAVFGALKADAQRKITPTGTESTKSVGGLTCTETVDTSANTTTYSCEIPITDGSNRALDAEAIYKGLDAEEVKSRTDGDKTWTKTVSGLTCQEVRNSIFSHTYSCSIFLK